MSEGLALFVLGLVLGAAAGALATAKYAGLQVNRLRRLAAAIEDLKRKAEEDREES
jgi:hypothetical protein